MFMTLVSAWLLADEKRNSHRKKYMQNKRPEATCHWVRHFYKFQHLIEKKSELSPKRLEQSEIIDPEIQIRLSIFILEQENPQGFEKIGCGVQHTCYPESTDVTDNNKRSWNQQAAIACKYLSGNTLARITLIRGKLFPDRYLLLMTVYWF